VATGPAVPERPEASQPHSASLEPRDPEPQPPSSDLHLRASDDERHGVVELLGDHAAAGRISLAELEERVDRAYHASTRAELAELTRDLPALSKPTRPGRKPSRWFFAIMGGSTRRGKRRLEGRLNVFAVMGGDDIDLREAEIEGSELVVNVFAVMGGVGIYLPDTVEVELSGPAIMGGFDERGSPRPPRPGAPLVRIRSFAIMGGVDVWRIPTEARHLRLKEARRVARALERGGREIGGHHTDH
jgi:Domain of unknown function (DUF1707)/Cell wall-active antibiotics response 4TMS YvqF